MLGSSSCEQCSESSREILYWCLVVLFSDPFVSTGMFAHGASVRKMLRNLAVKCRSAEEFSWSDAFVGKIATHG